MLLANDQKDALVRVVGAVEKVLKNTPILLNANSSGFEKSLAVENLYKATLDISQAAPILLPTIFDKPPAMLGVLGQKINQFNFGLSLTKLSDALSSGDADRIVVELHPNLTRDLHRILTHPICAF